jgi:hypothetical protein
VKALVCLKARRSVLRFARQGLEDLEDVLSERLQQLELPDGFRQQRAGGQASTEAMPMPSTSSRPQLMQSAAEFERDTLDLRDRGAMAASANSGDDWELDKDEIKFSEKIASGAFGDLYKGAYCGQVEALLCPGASFALCVAEARLDATFFWQGSGCSWSWDMRCMFWWSGEWLAMRHLTAYGFVGLRRRSPSKSFAMCWTTRSSTRSSCRFVPETHADGRDHVREDRQTACLLVSVLSYPLQKALLALSGWKRAPRL